MPGKKRFANVELACRSKARGNPDFSNDSDTDVESSDSDESPSVPKKTKMVKEPIIGEESVDGRSSNEQPPDFSQKLPPQPQKLSPQSQKLPPQSQKLPQPAQKSKEPPPPKYTRNHNVKCIGEMILPSGKQAVKYNVIMTPTASCPDRDKVTYVGYVTPREWEDGKTALSALGQSLKPFPKVLKCDEFEDYSSYLKEEHEIWEMGMTDDTNKTNLNIDQPSFHVDDKHVYFISGGREIWDLDVKPFGKKLTEEEIDNLPFCVMYSGTEIQYLDDPKTMLQELSKAWDLLNQAQIFAGPNQEKGSLFLGLGPSMTSSVLKGYLFTPAQLRGLMPHITAYLSGKSYGNGKSWAAIIAIHAALGYGHVKDVMLNYDSSPVGLWKLLDRSKIIVIDEISLDTGFLSTIADVVDNKFNNCKKQVNNTAYYPTSGLVLLGNYMKNDLINVKKGRDKQPILPEKTQSKMEFCFVGRKEIKHPDTKKMRDDSFEAAAKANKYFPNLLAIKWHSMFAVEDLDEESREKINSFTTGNRSGTFLSEFMTFWLSIKDYMVQYEVQLPPCLQSEEVDLNVHTYFLVNKDQNVEEFLKYVIESENYNNIEFCQHGRTPGVKLRPADFDNEWKDFLNDSRTTFNTTFKGRQERVTFLPTNSVSPATIEMLKEKRFTVENAIMEEILHVERELNKSWKKMVAEVKRTAVVTEDALNGAAPEEELDFEVVAGPSGVKKKGKKQNEKFSCDVPGCKKYGFPYATKTSLDNHKNTQVHLQGVRKTEVELYVANDTDVE